MNNVDMSEEILKVSFLVGKKDGIKSKYALEKFFDKKQGLELYKDILSKVPEDCDNLEEFLEEFLEMLIYFRGDENISVEQIVELLVTAKKVSGKNLDEIISSFMRLRSLSSLDTASGIKELYGGFLNDKQEQ